MLTGVTTRNTNLSCIPNSLHCRTNETAMKRQLNQIRILSRSPSPPRFVNLSYIKLFKCAISNKKTRTIKGPTVPRINSFNITLYCIFFLVLCYRFGTADLNKRLKWHWQQTSSSKPLQVPARTERIRPIQNIPCKLYAWASYFDKTWLKQNTCICFKLSLVHWIVFG